MELIIIGLVTAANFLILKVKAEQNRWADLAFDIFVLVTLSFLFSGTLGGLRHSTSLPFHKTAVMPIV